MKKKLPSRLTPARRAAIARYKQFPFGSFASIDCIDPDFDEMFNSKRISGDGIEFGPMVDGD